MDEHPHTSTTVIVKRRLPALAWMPRLVRENLTLHNALALIIALFTAGVWWSDRTMRNEVRAAVKEWKEAHTADSDKLSTLQTDLSGLKGEFHGFISGAGKVIDETQIPHGPPYVPPPAKRAGPIKRKP